MKNFLFTFNVIMPYFVLMMIGYIIKTKRKGDISFLPIVNNFVYKIALPSKLFYNVYRAKLSDIVDVDMFIFSLGSILIITAISILAYHLLDTNNGVKSVLVQATFRSNFLIFGLAIISSIYGSKGVAMAAVLSVMIVPLLNVLAILILTGYNSVQNKGESIKLILFHIAKNPLIHGISIGFIANISGFFVPVFLEDPILSLGACGTPIAFLMLGAQFSFERLRNKRKMVIIGTLARLVIVPAIALTTAVLMGFREADLTVLLILFAAPVAVSSYVMAVEAEADGELAGQLVISTTFFSIFTLFVFVFFFCTFGLIS